VQATLERLRQERLRPLIPSILLTGNGTPQFFFNGGIYGGGGGSDLNHWSGRSDVAVQVVWQAENLGFGNKGRVRERDAQNQQAVIELFRIQDLVAAEVAQAHAQVESARKRLDDADLGLREAADTLQKSLDGLSQTRRSGELLILVVRPSEAVQALQGLAQGNADYYTALADYNRAQFRLYRALGQPAQCLPETVAPPGEIHAPKVDSSPYP